MGTVAWAQRKRELDRRREQEKEERRQKARQWLAEGTHPAFWYLDLDAEVGQRILNRIDAGDVTPALWRPLSPGPL